MFLRLRFLCVTIIVFVCLVWYFILLFPTCLFELLVCTLVVVWDVVICWLRIAREFGFWLLVACWLFVLRLVCLLGMMFCFGLFVAWILGDWLWLWYWWWVWVVVGLFACFVEYAADCCMITVVVCWDLLWLFVRWLLCCLWFWGLRLWVIMCLFDYFVFDFCWLVFGCF